MRQPLHEKKADYKTLVCVCIPEKRGEDINVCVDGRIVSDLNFHLYGYCGKAEKHEKVCTRS